MSAAAPMQFKKAEKRKSKLRLALIGPSGAGKTYSALAIATNLEGPVAVIDTEHGSASKYADQFEFDVLELATYAPNDYVEAITAAIAAGYKTIVIDSLSHAWMGKNGALEMVDREAARSRSHNTFNAWREVTPEHNKMVEAIVTAKAHIIATMRAKTEYVMETGPNGKITPRKIGLAPVQRDGLEYEFDLVGDMDLDNRLLVGKTRISTLAKAVVNQPGRDLAQTLKDWLNSGTDSPAPKAYSHPEPVQEQAPVHSRTASHPSTPPQQSAPAAPPTGPDTITKGQQETIGQLLKEVGTTPDLLAEIKRRWGPSSQMTFRQADQAIAYLTCLSRIAACVTELGGMSTQITTQLQEKFGITNMLQVTSENGQAIIELLEGLIG